MQHKRLWQILWLIGFLGLLLFVGACKKKVAPPPPPPPPPAPPAAPTVTLRANPTVIERGGSSTLEWTSTNATDLDLEPGIGMVQPSGSTSVSPTESTTYTVTAKGPGGEAKDSVRITVTVPPPPPPPKPAPKPELKFEDAYFDFDKSDIRPDAREALTKDVEMLREYPNVRILIEGQCDERGSEEYNLGLGDRRANAAKSFLVQGGIGESRLETKSWGKERPVCTEHNEECWQRNRRAHFVVSSK